jgi:hypothetical protein
MFLPKPRFDFLGKAMMSDEKNMNPSLLFLSSD